MGEMQRMMRAYRVAHKYREEWYNVKWRAVVVMLAIAFIIFIYWYLGINKDYYWLVEVPSGETFWLSEKIFNWFMIGALFGIISVGMIFEGEFFLGLRHIARELDDAENAALKPPSRERKQKRRK